MTTAEAGEYIELADEHRLEGDLFSAGEFYTAAGFAYLAEEPLSTRTVWHYHGRTELLNAGLCYRISGRNELASARCRLGECLALEQGRRIRDYDEPERVKALHRGTWYEFVGDFRVVGELENVDEAYDVAAEQYRDWGDFTLVNTEQQNDYLITFFNNVSSGTDREFERVDLFSDNLTFTDWIEYKRSMLPEAIDELVEAGTWTWEQD